MEHALILISTAIALYYLYRMIKKMGCDCAGKCSGTAKNNGQYIAKTALCQRGKNCALRIGAR